MAKKGIGDHLKDQAINAAFYQVGFCDAKLEITTTRDKGVCVKFRAGQIHGALHIDPKRVTNPVLLQSCIKRGVQLATKAQLQ